MTTFVRGHSTNENEQEGIMLLMDSLHFQVPKGNVRDLNCVFAELGHFQMPQLLRSDFDPQTHTSIHMFHGQVNQSSDLNETAPMARASPRPTVFKFLLSPFRVRPMSNAMDLQSLSSPIFQPYLDPLYVTLLTVRFVPSSPTIRRRNIEQWLLFLNPLTAAQNLAHWLERCAVAQTSVSESSHFRETQRGTSFSETMIQS
jgi:hypothetical protein